MKPRLDRLLTYPLAPLAPRQPSPTAGARRARRLRQRRRNGVRLLTVEMNGSDLQALAKVAPQADPAVERVIHAVLKAVYGAHGGDRERPTGGPASETAGGDFCALCGAPGVLWKGLTPCSYGGKSFNAHPRCFAALEAGRVMRADLARYWWRGGDRRRIKNVPRNGVD